MACAGDVNGDGYEDVLIGAPTAGYVQFGDIGWVYLYAGGTAGLSADPVWSKSSSAVGDRFGTTVRGADVNGDGHSDVLIAAADETDPGVGTTNFAGYVHVFLGGTAGVGDTVASTLTTTQPKDYFGLSIIDAGDRDGDGRSDVAVGAPRWDSGATDVGRVDLFTGDATGVGPSTWSVLGTAGSASFGFAIVAGNIDGIGAPELAVGEPGADRVIVYSP